MPRAILLASLIALAQLTACAETDRYPISGEECGPDDPVQGLDTSDCLPPVS